MSERNTIVRSMHDLGLAAWFGGSLAGAVAVNGAAADVPERALRLQVANAGWARWTPVNAAAIGAHLLGGAGILRANRQRTIAQKGVGASTVAKLMLTGAALAVTAYSKVLGKALQDAQPTPDNVRRVQRQLDICQWLIPGLTGGVAVLAAVQGEQQRPSQQVVGLLAKSRRWLRAN